MDERTLGVFQHPHTLDFAQHEVAAHPSWVNFGPSASPGQPAQDSQQLFMKRLSSLDSAHLHSLLPGADALLGGEDEGGAPPDFYGENGYGFTRGNVFDAEPLKSAHSSGGEK